MSTIQLEITVCTCCYRPVYECRIARIFKHFGVPLDLYTEERVYPSHIHYEGTAKEV